MYETHYDENFLIEKFKEKEMQDNVGKAINRNLNILFRKGFQNIVWKDCKYDKDNVQFTATVFVNDFPTLTFICRISHGVSTTIFCSFYAIKKSFWQR